MIGYFIAGIIGLYGVLGLLMRPYSVSTERSQMIYEVSTVKNLVTWCRLYADDWDGQFPGKLRDLYPDYLDDEKLFRTNEFKKQEFKDYLYFADRTIEKDGTDMILIASPFVRKGTRVAGFTGGHVKAMKEDEYQSLLKSARMGYD